jgi:hypothetical protein
MRLGIETECAGHTVDGALELLSADSAVELSHAGLFVQFDYNGLLVVAEQAGEGARQWVFLWSQEVSVSARVDWRLCIAPFLGP